MALSLHEPRASSLIDADPASDPERHFCSGRGGSRPIDPKFRYRWDRTKYYNLLRRAEHHDYFSHLANYGTLAALGPHHRAALSANSNLRGAASRLDYFAHYPAGGRAGHGWHDDAAEGLELAHSNVALPSDRGRRPPSLERQEAFRDAKTTKKQASRSLSPARDSDSDSDHDDHDADLAELYRLGLLYDNEHERGSGFGFDAITHDDADLFHINVRPAKRGRKRKADEGWSRDADMRAALDLQLSFAALGDDEALARFLISPDDVELAPHAADIHVDTEEGAKAQATPPLTVVYELTDAEKAEDGTSDSTHLGNDISPSDTTSTHAHAHANTPEATDCHNLLSDQCGSDLNISNGMDMEEEDGDEDEVEEDEEEDNEWAILRDDHDDGDRDDNTAHVADSISIAAANPDAWIVLSASDGSKQVRT